VVRILKKVNPYQDLIIKPHTRGVFVFHLFVKKWGWGKLK